MADLDLRIVTHQDVDARWPRMLPLVQKCIDAAYHGEMLAEDALQLLRQDKLYAVVAYKGDEVQAVALFDATEYARRRITTCILFAGVTPNLVRELQGRWMDLIKQHAKQLGFDAIDCLAPTPVARLLRRLGFEHQYEVCRVDLE